MALHTAAAPVDQPHLAQTLLEGRLEVRLHDVGDLGGTEAVEVDRVLYGNLDRLVEGALLHGYRPSRWSVRLKLRISGLGSTTSSVTAQLSITGCHSL